jgi:hypothetical protein
MLLFISPFFLIPIGIGLVVIWAIGASLWAVIHRIRGPKVIYTPKMDSPEFIEAVRSGYTPRLGIELREIFPDPIDGRDIDRILVVREKLFPHEFNGFFFSVGSQDLSPAEFRSLAMRLFLEMAFTRSYLREKSSRLWPQKFEDLWIHHTPKPLRKLNPDYYRQLLTDFKKTDRTSNRTPIAV